MDLDEQSVDAGRHRRSRQDLDELGLASGNRPAAPGS